ncbi:MAG: hypothetical protein LIP77_01355 [Planctomycetes bacterium]|nr:hypothetical protein [Planctomycetota bacterium]
MRILYGLLLAAMVALSGFSLTAGEGPAPMNPIVDDDGEFFDPDWDTTPMEPVARQGMRRFRYGTILEYWLLPAGEAFVRMPGDPSLTGMVDDSRHTFQGASMTRDAEMKHYVSRQGVLQWTTYFRATRAGKHVFALASAGMDPGEEGTAHRGVALAFNEEEKIHALPGRDYSGTVDFARPGWYKMQVRIWWTDDEPPNFDTYGVTVKVREPGSLSLRALARKDLFYSMP